MQKIYKIVQNVMPSNYLYTSEAGGHFYAERLLLCNIAQKAVSYIGEYNEMKGDTLTLVYKGVILFLIVETRVWRFCVRKMFYF